MPGLATKLITILGPTACGKTRTASLLANKFNGEIISADSRQVYKYMNIGTGKDYDDYIVDGNKIPYHMIDIVEPSEEYNLFHYQKDCKSTISEIVARDKIPFLVGGSGLYLASILLNYNMNKIIDLRSRQLELMKLPQEELVTRLKSSNPNLHNTTDLREKVRTVQALMIATNNLKRKLPHPENFKFTVLGLKISKEEMKERIRTRLAKRFEAGMIEEVEHLLEMNISHDKLKLLGLEYFFISLFLQKELSYNEMFQKLDSRINTLAKHQLTWFRKLEKQGIKINWIDPPYFENAVPVIEIFLKNN